MYEILRLRATDRSNPEQYKAYRLTVKNRLNGPYQVGRNLVVIIRVGMQFVKADRLLILPLWFPERKIGLTTSPWYCGPPGAGPDTPPGVM